MTLKIYKITCLINNKMYIGQTQYELRERLQQHLRKAKKSLVTKRWGVCPKLFAAINKYGPENFTIEQIDTAVDRNELNKKEEYWIRELNTLNDGYNASCGGDNLILTSESRKKISLSKMGNKAGLGNIRSAEMKKADSERKMGSKNPMYGIPSTRRKPIICITNGQVYECLHHASEKLNLQQSNIFKVLKGKRVHTGGYKFAYLPPDAPGRG